MKESEPKKGIDIPTIQNEPIESFAQTILSESKDLDMEIVEMVNRKFEKLLLKI